MFIKNRPVLEHLGDTQRYQVMRFAEPEDRSIGYVLRRMLGIDIADDGAIYYNGKKIENMYIQRDDLMNSGGQDINKELRGSDGEEVVCFSCSPR